MNRDLLDPRPDEDQIEVSIFGPGTGEAIAIHLGGGAWMTIDSCIERESGRHALLEYFEEIDVDPATSIQLVVGTHAHDDHIAGIANLFERASNAQFVTSLAETTEQFFAGLEVDADLREHMRVGVHAEYSKVWEEVKRRPYRRFGKDPVLFTNEMDVLFNRAATADVPRARVTALSPSNTSLMRARESLREGLGKSEARPKLATSDPNEMAIALLVEVGDTSMLFGADLTQGPIGCGWRRIHDIRAGIPKSSLFKIPHHGSKYSHRQETWNDLLEPNALALVAPFLGGSARVPSEAEKQTILENTSRAYIVASTKRRAQPNTIRAAEAFLDIALDVYEPYGKMGQIRARRVAVNGEWSVDTYRPAHVLTIDS